MLRIPINTPSHSQSPIFYLFPLTPSALSFSLVCVLCALLLRFSPRCSFLCVCSYLQCLFLYFSSFSFASFIFNIFVAVNFCGFLSNFRQFSQVISSKVVERYVSLQCLFVFVLTFYLLCVFVSNFTFVLLFAGLKLLLQVLICCCLSCVH